MCFFVGWLISRIGLFLTRSRSGGDAVDPEGVAGDIAQRFARAITRDRRARDRPSAHRGFQSRAVGEAQAVLAADDSGEADGVGRALVDNARDRGPRDHDDSRPGREREHAVRIEFSPVGARAALVELVEVANG